MIFFIFILFFITIPKALAAPDFTFHQQIYYRFDQSGNAQVTHQIELINNYSNIYPKEYIFKINRAAISHVSGHDTYGNIIKNIATQNDITVISLKFNQAMVGKNNKQLFSIKYQIHNITQKKGKITEITLPQPDPNQPVNNLEIFLPMGFGQLAFSSLPPNKNLSDSQQTRLIFNNPGSEKILLALGDSQLFDFELNYHLQNNSTGITVEKIALPPDTETQKITFRSLNPKPKEITEDPDGNWIAQYPLSKGESTDILVTGQAKITSGQKSVSPSSDYLNQLTKEDQYWPVNHPQIKSLSQNLSSPKNIYHFVVDKLSYNYDGLNTASRKGALPALIEPDKSLCTEFTDLFIALARANNIPSREIEGYAASTDTKIKPVNQNTDILHAWPQYWDENLQQWHSLDPTWGKTTKGVDYFNDLDLNHLTFVIHGLSSTRPRPPGSYRNQKNQKSVNVSFVSNEYQSELKNLEISLSPASLFSPAFLTIHNPNLFSIYDISLSAPQFNWQTQINYLIPLSNHKIYLPKNSLWPLLKLGQLELSITSNNDLNQQSKITNPIYQTPTMIIIFIFFIIAITSVIIRYSK